MGLTSDTSSHRCTTKSVVRNGPSAPTGETRISVSSRLPCATTLSFSLEPAVTTRRSFPSLLQSRSRNRFPRCVLAMRVVFASCMHCVIVVRIIAKCGTRTHASRLRSARRPLLINREVAGQRSRRLGAAAPTLAPGRSGKRSVLSICCCLHLFVVLRPSVCAGRVAMCMSAWMCPRVTG